MRRRQDAWLASVFTRLETIPRAAFGERVREVQFYEEFLGRFGFLEVGDRMLTDHAADLAMKYGLHGMDALHVAAARRLRAERLLTTEKPTKRLDRVSELEVVHVPKD